LNAKASDNPSATARRSKSSASSSSLPASILEKSSTSLTTRNRDWPLFRMISAYRLGSASRSRSISNSAMPMTPLSGVRISWLILARNSLLARLAASAFAAISRA
jgi:hypothetical protein